MPLDLHRAGRQRLVEALAEGLPKVTTAHGMFLEHSSCFEGLLPAEEVMPTGGKLKARMVAYVDDFPVMDFIMGTLALELRERDKCLNDTPSIRLVDLEGYTDVKGVAELLVERFESLPWQYTLTLPLPDEVSRLLSTFVTELPLSDRMRLVRPTGDFPTRFPLASRDEKRHKRIHGGGLGLLIPLDPACDENATYLQIQIEGFVDMYGSTMPASDAKALLRAFCGLGIATRLFRIERVRMDYQG
jgi:hypothetical protein